MHPTCYTSVVVSITCGVDRERAARARIPHLLVFVNGILAGVGLVFYPKVVLCRLGSDDDKPADQPHRDHHRCKVVKHDDVSLRCPGSQLQCRHDTNGVELWCAKARLQVRSARWWEHGAQHARRAVAHPRECADEAHADLSCTHARTTATSSVAPRHTSEGMRNIAVALRHATPWEGSHKTSNTQSA